MENEQRLITEHLRLQGSATFRQLRRYLYHHCSDTRAAVTAAQLQQLATDGIIAITNGEYRLIAG